MHIKKSHICITEPKLLNTPSRYTFFKDQGVTRDESALKESLLKIASDKEANKTIDGDASYFDLEAEIKNHPDSLFVKCFAIKADEMNDNGDYFGYEELKMATSTFVGVPVFTNHNNTDAEAARGKVVHSWWDEDRKGIMIIARVDAEAYPQLARGIKEKYIAATSMGASRGFDLVTMFDNSQKKVEDLKIGDMVITHTGKTEPITAIHKTNHDFLHNIKWSNKSLALSEEHPVFVLVSEDVFTEGSLNKKSTESLKSVYPKFIPASMLKPNDFVLEFIPLEKEIAEDQYQSFDSFFYGNLLAHRITSIDVIENKEQTYYIQVGENSNELSDHSYILNEIITHNCQVKFSICSICHNKAENADSYCSHIRERKTRQISSKKQKCEYHNNGDKEECPICGCKKNEKKTFDVDSKVFEYNYGIKFIENSFVVNPACSDCGVTDIIDPKDFLEKISSISMRLPRLLKVASETNAMCDNTKCVKVAGQQEIKQLNDALDAITSVSKSMLEQKEQIDLEFLSDLVKVLADLQEVTDELAQQGYGRLQSPGQNPKPPDSQSVPMNENKVQQESQAPVHSVPSLSPSGKIHSGPAGTVGTVTSPVASKNQLNLKKVSNVVQSKRILKLKNCAMQVRKNFLNLKLVMKKPD